MSEPTNFVDRELVSIKTLSRMMEISHKTIWDWIYRNRKSPSSDPLPYYKVGGLVRFRPKDVLAWIDRRRIRPTKNAA